MRSALSAMRVSEVVAEVGEVEVGEEVVVEKVEVGEVEVVVANRLVF